MTIYEASARYQIPLDILRDYERWGLCGAVKKVMGAWQYDDRDLELLSLIMTLQAIGFSTEGLEAYVRLLLEGTHTDTARMQMLNRKRDAALNEIHFHEKQLERLDCLQHEFRTRQGGTSQGCAVHTTKRRPTP